MAFKHYLEEEDDKPYFTTNSLGYYYDKMEGFAEKVEQAAKILNVTKEEVEKNITAYIEQNKNELDQRLAQWDGKLETFDSSVETLLTEWVDDGTLTPLIDSTLINQRLAPVTEQLAEKADKAELVTKVTKGAGTLSDFDESTRATLQGLEPGTINAVLGIGNVKPENTDFFKTGKNLFNKEKATSGYMRDTGVLGVHADYKVSDNIIVTPGVSVFINYSYYFTAFFDSENVLISTEAGGINKTFTPPAGSRFMRFTAFNAYIDTTQVEIGTVGTSYHPYSIQIDADLIEDKPFNVSDIPDKSIDASKVAFAERGKNLYNHAESELGKFVNQTNGTLGNSASNRASGFVPVEPNTQYFLTQNSSSRIAYYDENKNYIIGASSVTYPIITPSNARYVRFSWYDFGDGDKQQFEKGGKATSFESYGYRLTNVLSAETGAGVELALPAKLYALVGQEFNIYFDNIMNDKDVKYEFDVICSVGQQLESRYRLTPTVAGSYPITIKVYQANKEMAVVSSSIKVTGLTIGSGVAKRAIVFGDSTTDNGVAVTKLNENFSGDVMNIETVGTRGVAPNNHEGRAGWTTDFYMNTAVRTGTGIVNPFYNPSTSAFDFSYYMTQQGFTPIHYFVINLGINDLFNESSDASALSKINTTIAQYEQIIASVKAHDPAIKIGIAATIPPNYSQDAFGKAYDSGQNRWRYKRNNFILVQQLITKFDKREGEGIYIIPLNVNIDTKHNYGFEEVKINARNEKLVSVPIANGGVHPTDSGYWQIADSYWYFFKGQEA